MAACALRAARVWLAVPAGATLRSSLGADDGARALGAAGRGGHAVLTGGATRASGIRLGRVGGTGVAGDAAVCRGKGSRATRRAGDAFRIAGELSGRAGGAGFAPGVG